MEEKSLGRASPLTLTTIPKKVAIYSYLSSICSTHLTKPECIKKQIFTILTICFILLTVVNRRLLSRYIMNYLSSLQYSLVTPVAFQQFMNDLFSDLLDICVVIYLYNILIYCNNMSVKKVLKYLYKAGLYIKAEKYEFYSELVEYLGYILFFSGLTMSSNKVKII